MTRFHFDRPDDNLIGENIISHLNPFIAPQGYGGGGDPPPPVSNVWINDEGNTFVTDMGLTLVFAP